VQREVDGRVAVCSRIRGKRALLIYMKRRRSDKKIWQRH
jgi:hypothetical protein